jgi:hypothetical protein
MGCARRGCPRLEARPTQQRSSEPASRKDQIGLAPLLPSDPSLVATTTRLRNRSVPHVINGRILNDRVEIPIERAASLRPTSRGFLPWRLSDDGPG